MKQPQFCNHVPAALWPALAAGSLTSALARR
jgi:hypothetical protein